MIYLSIQIFIYLSIYQTIHISTQLYISWLSILSLFNYPFKSIYLANCLSIQYSPIHPTIYSSKYLFTHPTNYLHIYLSIYFRWANFVLVHRRRRNFKSAETAESAEDSNSRRKTNHHPKNNELRKSARNRDAAEKAPNDDEQIFGGAAISLIDNGDNNGNFQRHNDELFDILDKIHSTTQSPAEKKLRVRYLFSFYKLTIWLI